MFKGPVGGTPTTTRLLAVGVLLAGFIVSINPAASAPEAGPLRPRVRQIFSDLLRFVPLQGHARLIIEAGGGVVLARAGQNNTVTLAEQAIALCYNLPSSDDGDACMAFVLGHELAHLRLHAPYLDADMFPRDDSQRGQDARFRRHLERTADRWGFIYATMAGYPVEKLIDLDGNGRDIFGYFQKILGDDLAGMHYPDPGERAATIRAVFEDLRDKSGFFRFGTVAAFFGDCDTAKNLLGALQAEFDAPEVNLNLGYCQLRGLVEEVARRAGEPALCLRPLVGIQSPLIRPAIRRGASRASQPLSMEQRRERLRPVHRSFYAITEHNPHHLTAWINQAIASFLAGYYARAEHEIIQARDILADNRAVLPYLRATMGEINLRLLEKELESLVWLIKSQEHEADLAVAIREMRGLIQQRPVPVIGQFNLIRLLEMTGQSAEAARLRESIRAHSHGLPSHCRVAEQRVAEPGYQSGDYQMPYTLPEPLNGRDPAQHFDVIYFPDDRWARIKDHLEAFSWKTSIVRTEKLSEFSFLWYRDRAEALRHEHQITFLVLRNQATQDLGRIEDLAHWCPGARPFPVSLGEIWDCQGVWASWVVNGEIREVWMDLRSL